MASLARLSHTTGGRPSERTNDLSLAYARAQRDSSCVYTIGVYLRGVVEDRPEGLTVNVKRPGLRPLHPERFAIRNETERRAALLRAAWIAPEMFGKGIVRAHLFPLRPVSGSRWDALLAVSFPVPLEGRYDGGVDREFGVVLSRAGSIVHQSSRRVSIQPDSAEVDSTPVVTFVERVRVAPGNYDLRAVLTDLAEVDPDASKVQIVVPEIPRKELFVTEPLLGRVAGPNVVVQGGDEPAQDRLSDDRAFEPLLVRDLEEPGDLIALTQICWVGGKAPPARKLAGASVRRSLTAVDGHELGDVPPLELVLDGGADVRCQSLVDVLPGSLLPDGEYAFLADVTKGDRELAPPRRLEFAVDRR